MKEWLMAICFCFMVAVVGYNFITYPVIMNQHVSVQIDELQGKTEELSEYIINLVERVNELEGEQPELPYFF